MEGSYAPIEEVLSNTVSIDWKKTDLVNRDNQINNHPEFAHLLKTDGLTTLPVAQKDRTEFIQILNNKFKQSLDNGLNFAIAEIDFEQLKFLNDRKSRKHGDSLILYGTGKLNNLLKEHFPDGIDFLITRDSDNGDEIKAYFFNLDDDKLKKLNNLRNQANNPHKFSVTEGDKEVNYRFGLSMGLSTSDTYSIYKNANSNDKDKAISDTARLMSNYAESESLSVKFLHELEDFEDLIEMFNDSKVDIEDITNLIQERYGFARVGKTALTALLQYCSIKVFERENNLSIKNNEIIQKGSKLNQEKINFQDIISELSKLNDKFQTIFEKGAWIPNKPSDVTEEEVKETISEVSTKLAEQSKIKYGPKTEINSDELINDDPNLKFANYRWNQINEEYSWQNVSKTLELKEEDKNSKFDLPIFNDRTRKILLDRCRKAILSNKEIGMIILDADDLKGTNLNYGHKVGDILINWLNAYASKEFSTNNLKKTESPLFISRDTAGDEIIILFTYNPEDSEDVKNNVQRLIGDLNETRTRIPHSGKKDLVLSASGAFVTSSEFQELTVSTRKKLTEPNDLNRPLDEPYELFNSMIRKADSEVKLVKSIEEISRLPLEKLTQSESVAECIMTIAHENGGGRISPHVWDMYLRIVSLKTMFDKIPSKANLYMKESFRRGIEKLTESNLDKSIIDIAKEFYNKLERQFNQHYNLTSIN